MCVHQYKEELFHGFEKKVSVIDFKFLPHLNQFRKETTEGFQNIVLSCSKYESELIVKVHLGSRLNIVEDWVNQFLNTPLNYQSNSNTIVTDLGKLSNEKYFSYHIVDLKDIEETIADMDHRMQTQGYRFLTKVSRVRKVNRLLNHCPSKKCDYYIHNHIHRYFKALTVARICNHPHFLDLIETYYAFLIQYHAPEKTLQDYDKLVSFLLHFSFN